MLKYKDFKLIRPNKDQVKKISELIENKEGSIFHEVELNKIVENTFHTQLFYLVDDPGNIKCFSPIHITKDKFGLKRYHFKPLYDIPYAGFVGGRELDLNKLSLGFFDSLKYEGFPFYNLEKSKNKSIKFGETSMVDLSLEEDEIFTSIIHSKKRNKIRKAIKEGITVKKYSSLEGLIEFYKILEPLHLKLGFNKKMNLEYYKRIYNAHNDANQAFVLLAYKDEKLISGVFILGNMNYMHYYKGASVFGIKNEGHGELLQWEAIKASKSFGAKYYDLCAINKEKLPAIYSFKTGISDKIVDYPIYSKNKLGFQLANRMINLF